MTETDPRDAQIQQQNALINKLTMRLGVATFNLQEAQERVAELEAKLAEREG